MYDPTFCNAFDRDTVVYPPGTLFVGQKFNTKEEAQDVINSFHIINHCTYKVSSSNQSRLLVQCVHDDCAWRCRVILRSKNQLWEILKLEGVHTCVSPTISQDHNKLGHRMIARSIHEIIQANPSTPVSTIIVHMKSSLEYTVTYKKAWLGKQLGIENVYSNWEESY